MPKKLNHETTIRSAAAEYLTFVSTIGEQPNSVELRYEDENIWLTQRLMAELYGVSLPAISQHIKQIYSDNELDEVATVKKYLIVQNEGDRQITREVNHYSLQMIIAVGFKVNNERAVQFRKWANAIVKDYTIQGWVMDDERLKKGGTILTKDYFEKQLEKVREIRLSERRHLKYTPKISFRDKKGYVYSNEGFIAEVRKALGLADDACWFVSELDLSLQTELHMKAHVVNKTGSMTYQNSKERKEAWSALL